MKMKALILIGLVVALNTSCNKTIDNTANYVSSSDIHTSSSETPSENNSLQDIVTWPNEYGPCINDVPVDIDDYEKVVATYIKPLRSGSGILSQSWKTPNEIPSELLIDFYAYNNFGNLTVYQSVNGYTFDNGSGPPKIAAELVEETVQRHFDVSTKNLRNAMQYNNDTNTYTMYDSFSSPYSFNVLDIKAEGSIIYIDVGYSFSDIEKGALGRLTIQIDNDIVKYKSFESIE